MGVAPEAIVKNNSGIDSKKLASCLVFPSYDLHKQKNSSHSFYLSSGAQPALPMGVAPEPRVGLFGGNPRLNNFL
jgi:hypothetical protein